MNYFYFFYLSFMTKNVASFVFANEYDLYCEKIVDLTGVCYVQVIYKLLPFENIKLKYDGKSSQKMELIRIEEATSSFAIQLDINLFNGQSDTRFENSQSKFLLANSEFKKRSTITGFEYYGLKPGMIKVEVVEFPFCIDTYPCSRYFEENYFLDFDNLIVTETFEISIDTGYNSYQVNSANKAGKRSMLVVTQINGALAIDSTNDRFISDYLIDSSLTHHIITRISYTRNSAVLFKAITSDLFNLRIYSTQIELDRRGNINFEIYDDLSSFNSQSIMVNDDSELDTLCSSMINGINFEMNCALNGYSFRYLQSTIQVNDSIFSLDISTDTVDFFGNSPTSFLSNQIENRYSYFLIPNAEIKFQSVIYSLNIFAAQSGFIEIGFLKFSVCGEIGESCWRYFFSNSILPTAEIVYSWSLELENGFNSIPIDNTVVFKGLVPYISYIGTGKVEIEKIDSFILSDYAYYDNDKTRIIKLSNEIPSRFLIHFKIDKVFFNYQVLIAKTFTDSGQVSVKSFFKEKINGGNELNENVATEKHLQLDIIESGSKLDGEIKFQLKAISQLSNENFFSIHESTEKVYKFNPSIKKYFGFDFPSILDNSKSLFYFNSFCLLNTAEFLISEYLIAFDIRASKSGSMQFLILAIDDCKDQNLCSEYLNKTMMIKNLTVVDKFLVSIDPEIQRYYVPKIKMLKNYLVAFEYTGNANIFVSKCAECKYSDFILKNGQLLRDSTYGSINYRFLINCIVETGYFEYEFSSSVKYSHDGDFDLIVGFVEGSLSQYKNVSIKDKKFLDIFCLYLVESEIHCTITGVSLFKDTEFYAIIDSELTEITKNQTETVDYFGIDLMNNDVVITNLYTPNYNYEYLLVNTEFLFDAYFNGFNVHALSSGYLYIKILDFGDNCEEANSSCASFPTTNTVLQNFSIKNVATIYVTTGKKDYSLSKTFAKKGSMILLKFSRNLIGYEENGNYTYSDLYLYGSELYSIKLNSRLRFIFNVLIDQKYYLTTIEFNGLITDPSSKAILIAFAKSKGEKDTISGSLSKRIEIIEKRQFLDLYCRSKNFSIECEILAISFSKNDSVEISNGNQISNKISIGSNKISYFGIEFSELTKRENTPILFFILSSSEFKFDSNLIGFEIFAKKSFNYQLSIIDFEDQCGFDSCTHYLSNNIGLTVKYKTVHTFDISFVKGYNKIYLNRKIRIKKGCMIGLRYDYFYDLFNFDSSFSNMRDFYINFRLYAGYGFRLMIRALIDEEFYLIKSFHTIQVQNYGTYNITAKLLLNSTGKNSVWRQIYISNSTVQEITETKEIIEFNTSNLFKTNDISTQFTEFFKSTKKIVTTVSNSYNISIIPNEIYLSEKISLTSFSSFDQLPISAALNYLKSNIDMGVCLANCSNNGKCKIDNGIARCLCQNHFTGRMCNFDIRKCSSNPCLNNGTCIDGFNFKSFKCECNFLYFGENCQFKIDVCKNITCSGNGYCMDKDNQPKCVCNYLFSGENCEIESNEIKQIKKTVKSMNGLAIAVIILFYAIFIVFDLVNYFNYFVQIFKILTK